MPTTNRDGLERRHDMEALRAFAMLIGIALHASLAFFPVPWCVQDAQQNGLFGLFFAAVHGFRMPLFFLMSGFFTAMLWRQRGLRGLLEHRARRIALPLLIGLVTIVPATDWMTRVALTTVSRTQASSPPPITALSMAVIGNHTEVVETLLEQGADPSAPNEDGSTPLHTAAFFGRSEMFARLLAAGADVDARNDHGHTAAQVTAADWPTTEYIAALVGIDVDREEIAHGRARVLEILAAHTGDASLARERVERPPRLRVFMDKPVFHHLWFLWFLCWIIAGFVLCASLAERLGWRGPPPRMMLSPLRYAWLIPLTLLPQWFMGLETATFGPDLSVGWLPKPHVLVFYALFFAFGALYFDSRDEGGRVGRRWRLTLPLGLFVLFPFGLEFAVGIVGLREVLGSAALRHLVAALLQAAYSWVMIFGLMGLFRRLLSSPRRAVRYVSDASYWLYLTHLPLVIAAQMLVQDWSLPASAKFVLIASAVTLGLLLVYQVCVRYTWIGRLLNGPRTRSLSGIAGSEVELGTKVS